MSLKDIIKELNISAQCRQYGLSLWQCPQFIFVVMGIIIIAFTLITYFVGARYIEDPLQIAFLVTVLTLVLFILGSIITQSFENIAEASRMKSEFVSIVSHQLRSPLSNLKWAIELLMSGRIGKIEKKQLKYFVILKENNARMQELIFDLLIVSRIEQGRFPLKKKPFSLEELTKELISIFEPQVQATNIKIGFKDGKGLPHALADRHQIKLVVENLIDNAIRYTRNHSKIEIKIDEKNKSLYFEVKDKGVGIPKKDQKYIFQKFFRSENVLKYQTQGTGLGLYIAKSIVEGSGGKIGFISEENKGSTFWFTLPIK
ncbi:MAG TPA: HAMP domain-containing sensor histidine kinase [Candidatus Parcubacteria bacterium]|nr:HAMP domain-containing sensor histidine kinase [Candidatus Parcubacteria bacterium]